MGIGEAARRAEPITGVSNVAFDLTALFYNKLQGLAALQTYQLDADEAGDVEARALFERLEQSARAEVDELRRLLAKRLDPTHAGGGSRASTASGGPPGDIHDIGDAEPADVRAASGIPVAPGPDDLGIGG